MFSNAQKKKLMKTYYDIEKGYSSIVKLSKKVNMKPKKVKKWLATQPTYTLHRQIQRKYKKTRRYVVFGINEQHQADLVDMSQFSNENKNHKFILTIIDVFSRKANAKALKDKSGLEVSKALKECWDEMGYPKRLQTDKGTEFYNRHVRALGIEVFSINSQFKASMVERFNRTIKEKMWKWFTYNHTHRWLDILPKIIDSYNNTIHRIIKMTPNQVNNNNETDLWIQMYGNLKTNPKPKHGVGTYVRISKIKKTFEKGYLPNWTREVFVIDHINTKYDPPLYYLKDLRGEKIEGAFYEQELQEIYQDKNQLWEIEKIVRQKGNKILVKWYGFPVLQWINRNDLVTF